MSGGKHTAGPWAATTRQGSWDWLVYSVANSNVEICQPFHDGTEFNEIGEANARLIAAAPDLLEALKDLAGESKETFAHWPDLEAQVEAAIAKAEGRAP